MSNYNVMLSTSISHQSLSFLVPYMIGSRTQKRFPNIFLRMVLQVLSNKNRFNRDKYRSLSVSSIHYFRILSHGGFWVTLSHPVTNFKKTVSPPKECLDAALCIICLLKCFVTSEGHYILLAIAKIACPFKGNASLSKKHIFRKKYSSSEGSFII